MAIRRRNLLGLIAAGFVGILSPAKPAGARSTTPDIDPRVLDGTWIFRSDHLGEDRAAVLVTFTEDGSCLCSTNSAGRESAAHGAWQPTGEPTGEEQFNVTAVALRFNADQHLIGTRKTNLRLTRSGGLDELLGEVQVKGFDLDSNQVSAAEGRIHGARLAVERFPGRRSATIAARQ